MMLRLQKYTLDNTLDACPYDHEVKFLKFIKTNVSSIPKETQR